MTLSENVPSIADPRPADRRAVWITLIVLSGIGFSFFFACATPFAALTTLAALKVRRQDMVAIVGLVWLANQVIGYCVLGYPWTWSSAAWGMAIGMSGLLALLAAIALSPTRRSAPLAISLPFVGAFATYELALYCMSFVLPGGQAGFTRSIVEQIFLVNLAALAGLLVAHKLAISTGILSRDEDRSVMASAAR